MATTAAPMNTDRRIFLDSNMGRPPLPSIRFRFRPCGRGSGKPRRRNSLILLEQGGEGVVMPFLGREDLLEEERRGLVPLVPCDFDDLLVHRDRPFFVLHVRDQHLLERLSNEDRRRLGGGDASQVVQPLGDRFRVLHLIDRDLLERVLDRESLDAFPEDVLPHVLHGHLDLPRDRLVQKVEQFRGRFLAGHRSCLLDLICEGMGPQEPIFTQRGAGSHLPPFLTSPEGGEQTFPCRNVPDFHGRPQTWSATSSFSVPGAPAPPPPSIPPAPTFPPSYWRAGSRAASSPSPPRWRTFPVFPRASRDRNSSTSCGNRRSGSAPCTKPKPSPP